MLNIIFFGTAEFALPSLKALAQEKEFKILGVVTQPDKPVGRSQVLTAPPIKTLAQKLGLKTWQPEKLSHFAASTQGQKIFSQPIDLIVVVAYGQILPTSILTKPRFGCLNVHASLLPAWRGAGAVQGPILAGQRQTGVTIMLMDEGLDTGPILTQTKIKIEPDETAGSLSKKLSILGAEILPSTIKNWVAGKIKPQPQDESQATYIGKITKQTAQIDWSWPAKKIERLIKAMYPWPRAWCWIEIKVKGQKRKTRLNILKAEIGSSEKQIKNVGEFFLLPNKRLAVQCGDGILIIKKLQLAGKKEMEAKEFLHGYDIRSHPVATILNSKPSPPGGSGDHVAIV